MELAVMQINALWISVSRMTLTSRRSEIKIDRNLAFDDAMM